MAYSDRTYVETGPGPGQEWVTVYFVKPLLWELYFGTVSVLVPVSVPSPHKLCLNKHQSRNTLILYFSTNILNTKNQIN